MRDLTPAQVESLRYAALGYSTQQTADRQHLSYATVKRHRADALHRSGTSNMANAVAWAIKRGYIDLETLHP